MYICQWLHRPAFEFEGRRRRSQRRLDLTVSAAVNGVNMQTASGVAISASPLTIAHGGAVTITITTDGTTVAPSVTDWIACYTPANADITKTVPARFQIGKNVCVCLCLTKCVSRRVFVEAACTFFYFLTGEKRGLSGEDGIRCRCSERQRAKA